MDCISSRLFTFISPLGEGSDAEKNNSNENNKEVTLSCLKGRVCNYIKAAPALITLVCLVLAVVSALALKQNYLSIVFTAGTFASIYGVYLACNFANLKTFEESNEEFKEGLKLFVSENEQLKAQVDDFKSQIDLMVKAREQLEAELKGFGEENLKFQSENVELKTIRLELEHKISRFETIQNTLSQSSEYFRHFTQSLSHIQESATSNYEALDKDLGVLTGEVQSIQKIHRDFESISSEIGGKMGEHAHILEEMVKTMGDTCKAFAKWKEDDLIKQRLDASQQILNLQASQRSEIEKASEMLNKIKAECSAYESQLPLLKTQVEQLNGQVQQLENLQKLFQGIVEKIQLHESKLDGIRDSSDDVKKLALDIKHVKDFISTFQEKRHSSGPIPPIKTGLTLQEVKA